MENGKFRNDAMGDTNIVTLMYAQIRYASVYVYLQIFSIARICKYNTFFLSPLFPSARHRRKWQEHVH